MLASSLGSWPLGWLLVLAAVKRAAGERLPACTGGSLRGHRFLPHTKCLELCHIFFIQTDFYHRAMCADNHLSSYKVVQDLSLADDAAACCSCSVSGEGAVLEDEAGRYPRQQADGSRRALCATPPGIFQPGRKGSFCRLPWLVHEIMWPL